MEGYTGLSVKVTGLTLRTPLIVASGILGPSASLLRAFSEKPEVGAIVTKTVTYEPRSGYENPTVVDLGFGFLNSMGLPNPGYLEYRAELESMRSDIKVPLIVSIGPSNEEEAGKMASALSVVADAFEVNLSCPHTRGLGMELGSDPERVRGIVSSMRRSTVKPVWVKISPNVTDFIEIARTAVEAGGDAITAINTVRGMAIDVNTMTPILSNVYGGLSGKAIHPVAVRIVYELYEKLKAPIIGCGGVYDWRNAVELILAGASAIQIGSAIAYSKIDLKIFSEVEKGIIDYLAAKGFSDIRELIGLAHAS